MQQGLGNEGKVRSSNGGGNGNWERGGGGLESEAGMGTLRRKNK